MLKIKTNQWGFTLIELMVVFSIIAILSAIAYPTFHAHLAKTRRSDGHLALLALNAAILQHAIENGSFQGITRPSDLGLGNHSSQGYYQLSIQYPYAEGYLLIATPNPQQAQANDTCGTLTLNHLNQKTPTLTGCW